MAHSYMKWLYLAAFVLGVAGAPVLAETSSAKPEKFITKPYVVPFERPIGFTLNLAAVASMTAEGRFLLGLAKNFSLVVSPMYQNTIEIPVWKDSIFPLFMDIRRVNVGLGVRGHFYEYDSWDGWYLEAMGRGGATWISKDPWVWSIIPSLNSSDIKVENWAMNLSCRVDEKSALAYCQNADGSSVVTFQERRQVFYKSLEADAKKSTTKHTDILVNENGVQKNALSFNANECEVLGSEA